MTSAVDREYLENVIGVEAAAAVTDHEDHDDVAGGDVRPLRGTVRNIAAVSCHFAPQGRALYPSPGTALVERRSRADGWEHEDESLRFLGYIVTLSSPDRTGARICSRGRRRCGPASTGPGYNWTDGQN
jgi:hypothetical protein